MDLDSIPLEPLNQHFLMRLEYIRCSKRNHSQFFNYPYQINFPHQFLRTPFKKLVFNFPLFRSTAATKRRKVKVEKTVLKILACTHASSKHIFLVFWRLTLIILFFHRIKLGHHTIVLLFFRKITNYKI
jgi:hypothetical protein